MHTVGEAKSHFARHGVPVRPKFKRGNHDTPVVPPASR
jgi:hypothetical protein